MSQFVIRYLDLLRQQTLSRPNEDSNVTICDRLYIEDSNDTICNKLSTEDI